MTDIETYRAKKAIKKELNNSSWNLQHFESVKDLEMMVYSYDHFNTGDLSLAGMRASDIRALSKFKHPMDAICSSVDAAFNDYTSAKNEKARAKKTELLASVLGLYAINTRTFKKLMNEPLLDGQYRHFIVLLYRGEHSTQSSLRPFSLVSDKKVHSPDEIKSIAQDMINRDEQKNSGFFNFQPVSNI